MRQTEKERTERKGEGQGEIGEERGEWKCGKRERQNRRDRGREGKRCISGSTGSKLVHTLRVAVGGGTV